VWVTAAWADGHPVTEPASAIITAVAAGERVGPAPLRATGDGAGTLTYSGQLPQGRWTVTAEMVSPAVARCDAEIDVGAPPAPAAVTCTPPEAAPAATAPARRWPWVTVVAAALAALLAGFLLARRRRPPARRPAARR
jgi:hypothetical protein